jgi:hypothetical protein
MAKKFYPPFGFPQARPLTKWRPKWLKNIKEVQFTEADRRDLSGPAHFFEAIEQTMNTDHEVNLSVFMDVLIPGIKLLNDLNVRIALRFDGQEESAGAR